MLDNYLRFKYIFFKFLNKNNKFLITSVFYLLLFFVAPHCLAGTTSGDLGSVDTHVHTEVTGDILDILAWVSFAMGCITAVTKMSMGVVITMFSLFLVFILGPTVIAAHFSALI